MALVVRRVGGLEVGSFMTRVPVHVVRRVGGLEGQRRGFAH